MTDRPITEEDLHGFVDRSLDPSRDAEVSAYLEQHPEVAMRIDGYVQQRNDLRAALAPIAEEPLPPELNLARMIAQRGQQRQSSWRTLAAAAVVLLGLGGAGGWLLRGFDQAPSEGVASVAQEAAENYAVFAPDQIRPVEMRADERAKFVSWATERLGRPVAIPNLAASGYRFMGGRIVTTGHGPAAMLMYDDDRGARLVMLTRPMQDPNKKTPMSSHNSGAINGFAWADQGLGYSLIGKATPDALHPIAAEVRRQLSSGI